MTPKEYALSLINEIYLIIGGINSKDLTYFYGEESKKIGLLIIGKILEELPEGSIDYGVSARRRFFEEVKLKLEKF